MGTAVVIIVIVIAVLEQMIKNIWAGRNAFDSGTTKETVADEPQLHIGGLHRVASCGCDMVDGRVVMLCSDHQAQANGLKPRQKPASVEWLKDAEDLERRQRALKEELALIVCPGEIGNVKKLALLYKKINVLNEDVKRFRERL
jgi:hypothetical protein